MRTFYKALTSLLFAAKRNTQLSRDVLAQNARTSTLMLDRHYLSKLENDDLADALHARDKSRSRKSKSYRSRVETNAISSANQTKPSSNQKTST
jgi:hypothetical protein